MYPRVGWTGSAIFIHVGFLMPCYQNPTYFMFGLAVNDVTLYISWCHVTRIPHILCLALLWMTWHYIFIDAYYQNPTYFMFGLAVNDMWHYIFIDAYYQNPTFFMFGLTVNVVTFLDACCQIPTYFMFSLTVNDMWCCSFRDATMQEFVYNDKGESSRGYHIYATKKSSGGAFNYYTNNVS